MVKTFFINFILNNSFVYNYDLPDEDNFQNLIKHMKINISSKAYQRFYSNFQNSKEDKSYIEDKLDEEFLINIEDDLRNIQSINSTHEFFEYFIRKYNLDLHVDSTNFFLLFQKLARLKKWTNLYDEKCKKFNLLRKGEVSLFLKENFDHFNLKFNPKEDCWSNFHKLSKFMNWDNYYKVFLKKFNQLVGIDAEEKFKRLESLQEILKRYQIQENSKIPNSIKKCKKLIRKFLFVNIYDFINPKNTQKFKNLFELKKYTIKHKLFYHLHLAKQKFCYKVLLRPVKS